MSSFPHTVTVLLLAALTTGCGSSGNIGRVSGQVTLQGEPLANALVIFEPVVPGGSSYGRTDESGKYSLTYRPSVMGAEIGEHLVRITSGWPANPDTGAKEIPERVVAKYNRQSELKREVKKGRNTIDFEL